MFVCVSRQEFNIVSNKAELYLGGVAQGEFSYIVYFTSAFLPFGIIINLSSGVLEGCELIIWSGK